MCHSVRIWRALVKMPLKGERKVGRLWRNPLKCCLISDGRVSLKETKLSLEDRRVSLPLGWKKSSFWQPWKCCQSDELFGLVLVSRFSFSRAPDNHCIQGSCGEMHGFFCSAGVVTVCRHSCAWIAAALQAGVLLWKNNTCPPPTGASGTAAQMINLIQPCAAEPRSNLIMPLWFVATEKVQFLLFFSSFFSPGLPVAPWRGGEKCVSFTYMRSQIALNTTEL